jgi:putative membrane protein
MNWILQLLINAAILLLAAKVMPTVKIKSFGTAVLVALVIGILNATIGGLLRFPLNLVTFYFLSFFVRLIVLAIMIKIADKFFSGFEVQSFTTALILAAIMAIAGSLVSHFFNDDEARYNNTNNTTYINNTKTQTTKNTLCLHQI